MPVIPSKPGERRGGRQKGTTNKTTALLKDAILEAASLAGGKDGLVGYLLTQATTNPGPYLSLLGKVLPLQLTGANGGPLEIANVSNLDRAKALAALIAKSKSDDDAERLRAATLAAQAAKDEAERSNVH
jgi:hypothetical protein